MSYIFGIFIDFDIRLFSSIPILFVAFFCNYSRFLSMHQRDSDADSKVYYQKTTCKRDLVLFVLSVSDFGALVKISSNIWYSHSFRIMNHTQFLMMQTVCICDFLMYEFCVVLAYQHFHGYKVFCITKNFPVKVTPCFS